MACRAPCAATTTGALLDCWCKCIATPGERFYDKYQHQSLSVLFEIFYKMVKLNSVSAALLLSSFSAISLAHPEDHEMHDALHERDNHAAHIQRRLANCANNPKFLALQERGMQRRSVKAQQLRQARGISDGVPIRARHRRRDLTALEAFELVNHNMTSQGYTEATSASTLFASYKNASCILTPEVTYGPYYGMIRS